MSVEHVDMVMCGLCQKQFPLADILTFIQHKRFDCEDGNLPGFAQKILLCQSCPQKFKTPWSLLQHAQRVHSLQIYLEQGLYGDGIQSIHIKTAVSSLLPYPALPSSSISPNFQATNEDVVGDISTLLASAGTGGKAFDQRLPNISTLLLPPDPAESRDQIQKGFTQAAVKHQPASLSPESDKHVLNAGQENVKSASSAVMSGAGEGKSSSAVMSGGEDRKSSSAVMSGGEEEGKSSDEGQDGVTTTEVPSCCNPDVCADMCICREGRTDVRENRVATPAGSCCNNQDCGVTVMPGTHEKPKKCCSAVIPKKRKRHMVTTHLSKYGRRRSVKSKSLSGAFQNAAESSGIFIDFEHSADNGETFQMTSNFEAFDKTLSRGEHDKQQSTAGENSGVSRADAFVRNRYGMSNTKSVIIQPGSTFSIPLPHSQSSSSLNKVITSISDHVRATVSSSVMASHTPPDQGSLKAHPDVEMASPVVHKDKQNVEDGAQRTICASEAETAGQTGNLVVGEGHSLDDSPEEKLAVSKVKGRKRQYPTSRPYKCTQCDLAFNQRVHLRKHESKHTGIKPYKCEQCDYSTVERSHLKVHIRIHTGEKPFKCTYCEYATAQNSTLKIHLKRHHGNSINDCRFCGKGFPHQKYLAIHMKNEHSRGNSHKMISPHPTSVSSKLDSQQAEDSAHNQQPEDTGRADQTPPVDVTRN